MNIRHKTPLPKDMPWLDPERVTVEIALFDDADRADTQRNVPLSRFLDELRKTSATRP